MPFYPEHIESCVTALKFAGEMTDPDAVGTSMSFECGSFVRFYLLVKAESLRIEKISYQSNGCGFAVEYAEKIAEFLSGKALGELGGLDQMFEGFQADAKWADIPADRRQCRKISEEAVRSALSDFRELRAAEFSGEKALICSCFGVDEVAIEQAIAFSQSPSLESVADETRAGSGCGACRMLIQEIIDERNRSRISGAL